MGELMGICGADPETTRRMPVRFRMGGRVFVQALKRLDPRLWSIPYANTGVRVDTPEGIAWAVRLGAELPLAALKMLGLVPRTHTNESWPDRAGMLRTPRFREILKSTLWDPECFDPAAFDADRLAEIHHEHMSHKRRHMRTLLCLITFGRWFKQHGPAAL